MTPMKPPPRWSVYRYRHVLAIFSIVTLLLAALITTTRDGHGSTIAALPGATAQPSVPGGGSGGSGGSGGGPPFPMQPPAMPDAPAPYNGGSYPAPYQGNGIDINNPAQQPAQAPQQQPNFQQTNPEQLQPANGQQPPDYDAPLQSAQPQPQPQQQPQQSQQQQQPEEQEQNQQEQQTQQKRKNPCEPNEFLSPKTPKLDDDEQKIYDSFTDKARKQARELYKNANGLDKLPAGKTVDHVLPLRRLWDKFKEYGIKNDADKLAIANNMGNLALIWRKWNSSKKDSDVANWNFGDDLDPYPPTQQDLEDMCADEQQATEAVMKAIAQWQAQQASKVPSQTGSEPSPPKNSVPAPNTAVPQAPKSQAAPVPATPPLQAPQSPQAPMPPVSPAAPSPIPTTLPPATQAPKPNSPLADWVDRYGWWISGSVGVISGVLACVADCVESAGLAAPADVAVGEEAATATESLLLSLAGK